MMRRLLSIVCATGLLVTGMASLASASDTVWNYRFEGTTVPTGITGRGSTAYAVSSTVAGVIDDPATKDSKDTGTPPAAIYPVVITAWYRPTWGAGLDTPPWAFLVDTRTPLGTGPIEAGQSTNYFKTWADLVVWTSIGFNTAANPTIYLHVIPAIGASAPPTVLGAKAIDYKLVMTQWP
ncbi:MAG: hypothetical protein WCL39_11080, partial [Armatimonadota bacterium]